MRMLVSLALIGLVAPLPAQDNQSRREFATPGLVVETGYRTAACDVLTFTSDGQYLLAAGDDKVVRTWRFLGKSLQLIPEPAPAGMPLSVLRWPSFREKRGNIYAMTFSPDDRHVAVAGLGLRDSQTAVLDRFSGAITHILPFLPSKDALSIRAIAYSPSGKQVAVGTENGGVWVWDLNGAARQVGKHLLPTPPAPGQRIYNHIYGLAFLDDDRLLSADEHGLILQWDPHKSGDQKATEVFQVKRGPLKVWRYAFTPDKKLLAAAAQIGIVQVIATGRGVLVKEIGLPRAHTPSAIALDKDGQRLAVAASIIDQQAQFQRELGNPVHLFDLAAKEPGGDIVAEGSHRIEGVAFHPDGKYLAMAGGKNHEVTLWDLSKKTPTPISKLESPGSSIWQVALHKNRYLAYKTDPNRQAANPNEQGLGAWKVFDLEERRFVTELEGTFQPPGPLESVGGWKVVTRDPSKKGTEVRAYQWFAQDPQGMLHPLPWDPQRDGLPRCYSFLPQKKGGAVQLAVGMFNGVAVFELSTTGLQRLRYMVGHDGEVMSLAVDPQGKYLVTGSRDQTIAGWSLEDWPHHPQLGAKIVDNNGKLMVEAVQLGGPIWEAGLSAQDEILFLGIFPKVVYNRDPAKGKPEGSVAAALAALARPEAGKEIFFTWKRPGETASVYNLTTLRDRPIWRFFPTRDREWALWRWQDFYFDTSTKGDSFIGWHVNFHDSAQGYDVRKAPRFFQAEQFREQYHKPAKLSAALKTWGRAPTDRIAFSLLEPPHVDVQVDAATAQAKHQVKDADVFLDIRIAPPSGRENQQLTRVVLWINDFQYQSWERTDLAKHLRPVKDPAGLPNGVFALDKFRLPRAMLRSGPNSILVQAVNKADIRGDSKAIRLNHAVPRPPSTLHGLFIGVGDYAKAKPPQNDLFAHHDAEILADYWKRYRSKLYNQDVIQVLTNNQVTPQAVTNHLESLAKKARPDDLLVLHLGGHGMTLEALLKDAREALAKKQVKQEDFNNLVKELNPQGIDPKTFLFLTSKFDLSRLRATTINLEDFYERLVKMPCHKLILLDACHAGAAKPDDRANTDLVRFFTRDKVGPILLSACTPDQRAWEVKGLFKGEIAAGLFAQSILQTLARDFDLADLDKNGTLDPQELFSRMQKQIPAWIEFATPTDPVEARKLNMRQTPVLFLPELERNLAIIGRTVE